MSVSAMLAAGAARRHRLLPALWALPRSAVSGSGGVGGVVGTAAALSPAMHADGSVAFHSASRLQPLGLARGFASSLPEHTVLAMPALSPTMSQGNLARWHVKVGEQVGPGSVLADIETDKATLAFENQEDGFIAKLLVQEGTSNIPVGQPVAVMVEDEADVPKFAEFSPSARAAETAPRKVATPAAAPATPAAAPSRNPSSYPAYTRLDMPSLSPTMERGNIVRWAVSEGDEVKPGDVLAEIETDKATLAFENQEDGFVAKIVVPAGSKDVAVGTLVAVIVEEKEHVAAFKDFKQGGGGTPDGQAAAAAAPAPAAKAAAPAMAAPCPANHRVGPAVRMMLQEAGLSLSQIAPTGPNGIVTKGDVMAAIKAGIKPAAPAAAPAAPAAPASAAQQPAAAQEPAVAQKPAAMTAAPQPSAPSAAPRARSSRRGHEDVPNTQMRKIIAARLLESKTQIPAMYASVDVRLDEVARLRKGLADQGIKVSVNDLVMKSIAAALNDVPEANAFWDAAAAQTKRFPAVDVAVAVATPGGLITPIVKGANKKPLREVSSEVRALAARARDNKLKPEEFMGGSFTVSNLGMMGVAHFCAIVNPPQAAILAVGTSQSKAVLADDGTLSSQSFMTVTLSADHRVYDGDLAARLLGAFKAKMEHPSLLLL